ncbi:MAG TPA: hypothetical protein VGX76_19720 [Pirellulales bacterium]|jgi:hypothetical protein|nr:hypothetical protein [Pirellulales bacterium]
MMLGNQSGQPDNDPTSVRNKRIDRIWLYTNLAIGVVLWAVGYMATILQEAPTTLNDEVWITAFFGVAGFAFFATLLVVGIPSRFALNILIKKRWRPYFGETIVLALTFMALVWMVYVFATVHIPHE